jgi:copper homeostasis protein
LVKTLEEVSIPVVALVRPRAGDFRYSESELDVLLRDVRIFREAGAHGIATGALDLEGGVDLDAMGRILEAAGPVPITFHRAFDMTKDPMKTLEDLIQLGIPRVLTSGLEAGVMDGIPMIQNLVESSKGAISIMPGGGVRPTNVGDLIERTGVREVHFTAFSTTDSPMIHRNPRPRMGGRHVPGEFERTSTDPERVRLYVDEIRAHG